MNKKTMKLSDLEYEFKQAVDSYNTECDNNGGREGTTRSLWLEAQCRIMIDFALMYYGVVFSFTKRI